MVERGTRKNVTPLVRAALADALGMPATALLTPEDLRSLQFLKSAISVESSEAVVWQLKRCLESGSTPVTSKFGAVLAIQKLKDAHPKRRTELEAIQTRINELYR